MKQRLKRIERTFVISIVGLVLATLLTLVGTLLITNVAGYDKKVSPESINKLITDYPDVANYLESQKKSEAHFVTIATLVKQNQQRSVWHIVIWAALPIILTSAVLSFIISRRLLRPVEESYAAQERFIQDAAHELRNPLAAMSATLETAKISDDNATTIARLERQTKQLIRINEDLLFLQRAAEPSNAKQQDISLLADSVIEQLRPTANDKRIIITSDITPHLKYKILPRDFELVLRNLLDNAIKYSPEKSKVMVELKHKNKHIELSVTDNGIGIPANELSSVTDRFYRAKNSSAQHGSGLGLALVQKVVDAYGASMTITSHNGTKIVIKF